MNLAKTIIDMGEVYLEKVSVPKNTFAQVTKNHTNTKSKKVFTSKHSGPENAEGYDPKIVDPKTAKKNNFFQPEKFSQKNEKTEIKSINNFMNKSIFDKLYEDVMSDRLGDTEVSDAEALGLPGEGDGGEGDMNDEVTITMDRETAQKLHDLLMGVLGGDEEVTDTEDGDEMGDVMKSENEEGEEDHDEDENTFGEATDITELKGKGESLQGKNNKVGDVTSKLATKGGGDGAVTDEVGTKNTNKHALVSDTDTGNLKGKNNKVTSKTSKVGEYLAGLK